MQFFCNRAFEQSNLDVLRYINVFIIITIINLTRHLLFIPKNKNDKFFILIMIIYKKLRREADDKTKRREEGITHIRYSHRKFGKMSSFFSMTKLHFGQRLLCSKHRLIHL